MTLYAQDRILSADKVEIKPDFETRYRKLLGDRYDEFIKFSFTYMRKCIRVNTLKISVDELKKRVEDQGFVLTPVPWCKEGFTVEGHRTLHRFDIGNLPEHALGYFYVQEAASMIPPVALFNDLSNEEILSIAQSEDSLRVLDLCAAPGSKTSQLAQYMGNKGILIANDVDVSRLKPLSLNLQRMGVTNHLVTLNAFQQTKKNTRPRNPFEDGVFFDRILVDAPCSGTGTIRRSFKAMTMYSYGLVRRISQTQRVLISHAFTMLKPGGYMIYSTCTQEPEENEAVVSYLLDKFPDAQVVPLDLNIIKSEPVLEFEDLKIRPELKDAIRIYPQDNDGEGFFVCKILKKL
ncbi:NOL1/NOP2/sun family putative RNA methylase [Candidatus Woesearchaeota archaeon]|nr:NOL1/NOP2/sun family putative RNA methylase [Candidatus Woesearchaeota archaeon]